MSAYEDEDLLPAPREVIWRLLRDHLDDAKIVDLHPLVRSQKTVRRVGDEVIVDRVVDVRRKPTKSRWKFTYHPPERARWEVVEGEGPWGAGSFLDLAYEEEAGGTRVRARGSLSFPSRPFYVSEERAIRTAFDDLRTEDVWFLRRYRY